MKKIGHLAIATVSAIAMAVSASTWAASPQVQQLQSTWAKIKYQAPESEQEDRLGALLAEAKSVADKAPDDADTLIWYAVIESSYAGARGGLGALSHVKNARALLEKAIEKNPNALGGSALTSLGALYYQVPGWPLAFGSDSKAEKFLKRGLAANPNGIDANYFYGDFLFEQGELVAAEKALRHALEAPARAGRELADQGRRQEIEQLLKKISVKMASAE